MSTSEKALELKVGVFVLIGVAFIAVMALRFGRLGEGLRDYYNLTVEFANASGLLKDSNVLLNGAKIGWVATTPTITNNPKALEEATGVVVEVRVYSDVRIPEGSRFQVSSSGLLGDRFVDVLPPRELTGQFLDPESVVAGSRQPGIDDLTREGTDLLEDLRDTVGTINSVVTRVDREILSKGNVEDVEILLANFRGSSENINATTKALSDSGKRIDEILENANRTVLRADEAMVSAKLAGEDVRVAMQNARDTIETVQGLVEQTSAGRGVIGKLMADEKLASDLEALIANLKEHGIIFYKDSSGADADAREGNTRPPRAPATPATPGNNPARR